MDSKFGKTGVNEPQFSCRRSPRLQTFPVSDIHFHTRVSPRRHRVHHNSPTFSALPLSTPDNVPAHSHFHRRVSPRRHRVRHNSPNSHTFSDLRLAPKTVSDSKPPSPNDVSAHSHFLTRVSPRRHNDHRNSLHSPVSPDLRLAPKTVSDSRPPTPDDVPAHSNFHRRVSPRWQNDHRNCLDSPVFPDLCLAPKAVPDSKPPTPDDVPAQYHFHRRVSPRQHRDITSESSTRDDIRKDYNVSRGASPHICVNMVAEIERRLSPRLHPNPHSKDQEDASKESVFQRRLSPRLLPDKAKEKLNSLFNSCKTRKRVLDDFHAGSAISAKRNKLQHPEAEMNSTHLHSTGTDGVSDNTLLHLSTHGLHMSNKTAQNNNVALDSTRRNLHAKVKETLRIYNTYYLQLVQEEEDRRKQQELEKAKGDTSKSKGKGNYNTLKYGKKGQNSYNEGKREKHKLEKETEERTVFQADLKALTRMIKSNETLNPEMIIGPLPGIDVGHQFYSRAEMVAVGLHKHWLDGIAYVGKSRSEKLKFSEYTLPIALSVVMSGHYEDDLDNSEDVIYTGHGGHELVGSKLQCKYQKFVRGNLALKNSMDQSVLIRVMRVHDSPDSYSGKTYSYDGLYKVVEILSNRRLRGHLVYRYMLKGVPGQPKQTPEQVEFVRGFPPRTSSNLPGLIYHDITNGQEDICIPVTNIFDDPPVGPAGFTYIKTIEVQESVKLPPAGTGCTCKGSCTNPSTCACAKLNGSHFPYVRHRGGRLIEPKDIVFECGPNCGCGPECLNRTSQRGIKYHLEVYRTSDKGWAVRTRDFIPSGAPVCEYVGVLSRSDELDNVAENDYIFEIDCLHTMYGIEGRERRYGNLPVAVANVLPKIDEKTLDGTPEFSIDACSRGNVARFINHSCEPNLFVQCILSAYHDLRLTRIVLFAADDISPMQELSYDYGYALDSVVGPDGKVQALPCFCGTAECRKRLY